MAKARTPKQLALKIKQLKKQITKLDEQRKRAVTTTKKKPKKKASRTPRRKRRYLNFYFLVSIYF